MRTFYIFKINKEFKTITKNRPYNLYLALENIHSMSKSEINLAYKLYGEICENSDMDVNSKLFNELKNSDYYTKFNNEHLINNYYTDENSKLTVNNSFFKIKTTINNPSFFKNLCSIPNLFVIDFSAKDYFWLS